MHLRELLIVLTLCETHFWSQTNCVNTHDPVVWENALNEGLNKHLLKHWYNKHFCCTTRCAEPQASWFFRPVYMQKIVSWTLTVHVNRQSPCGPKNVPDLLDSPHGSILPTWGHYFPHPSTWKNFCASEFQTGNLKNVPVHFFLSRKSMKVTHKDQILHALQRESLLRGNISFLLVFKPILI